MLAPIRPLTGRWPALLERKAERFFWKNPTVVLDPAVSPDDFRTSMSAIHVGDTIKITGANRHPEADALLVDNVDLEKADIVDIGASDGSTSVDLIAKLPTFRSYVIADLFFNISCIQFRRRAYFFAPDGECILVVGPRVIAWPSQSKAVRILYSPIIRGASRRTAAREDVLLLNPEARTLIEGDSRISYRIHDVFERWTGDAPSVVKVANLLRRLYFSDADIVRALTSIHQSLREGGYLLMVDNNRIKGMPARAGLYQRSQDGFVLVARTTNVPEVEDLILAVRVH